ncbi:MAG TPA: hypothetical protein DHW02_10450, partial [Ktedonobacter sp.]|nr:hypothetical protein [Ktedonobacter sp.]
ISYDHMHILGDTLAKIATEKAGIIKENGIVVTSAQSPEALLAIATIAQQRNARMVRVGAVGDDPAQTEVAAGTLPPMMYRYQLEQRNAERQRFTIHAPDRLYTGLETTLAGQHQLENATTALATLDLLREHGLVWDENALREGFLATRWSARMEVVGHEPTIVVDGAHNADSMRKLIQGLRDSFPMRRLIVVLSSAKDKDLAGMVQALADIDMVILTRMKSQRVVKLETFAELFAQYAPHVEVRIVEESWQAMDRVVQEAHQDDVICATGSLYLAAEVLRWSAAHGNQDVAATIEGSDHE